jgi:hypothetical protein
MREKVEHVFASLKDYCEREDFKGYDPYDGLNSKIFQAIPFLKDNRLARLAWIQTFKRSPVNLRPLLRVPKAYNPKGLGLFLSGYCTLYRRDPREDYERNIRYLIKKILELKSTGWSGSCWGYNFDWQARAFFQPKFMPTVVASTFIGYALLDAYDVLKEKYLLDEARSVCDFILKDLNRTYDENGDFLFSYSPLDKTQVFNASLLGARMLARTFSYTGEAPLVEVAKKTVSLACKKQSVDGSWTYGTLPFHQWIDNFHTGYNLECIFEYARYSGDFSFETNLENGLNYYLETFFSAEGIPKYYNNSLYPIDIHSTAQLIVTLYRMGKLGQELVLVNRVLDWTIDNMRAPAGYFYFQKKKSATSRISYIRWAQGWMFFSLAFYLDALKSGN